MPERRSSVSAMESKVKAPSVGLNALGVLFLAFGRTNLSSLSKLRTSARSFCVDSCVGAGFSASVLVGVSSGGPWLGTRRCFRNLSRGSCSGPDPLRFVATCFGWLLKRSTTSGACRRAWSQPLVSTAVLTAFIERFAILCCSLCESGP